MGYHMGFHAKTHVLKPHDCPNCGKRLSQCLSVAPEGELAIPCIGHAMACVGCHVLLVVEEDGYGFAPAEWLSRLPVEAIHEAWGIRLWARRLDEQTDIHCQRAVAYADSLGIYAVPHLRDGRWHWIPRMPSGYDPDLDFMLAQSTPRYYRSWAEAVMALGQYMESKP